MAIDSKCWPLTERLWVTEGDRGEQPAIHPRCPMVHDAGAACCCSGRTAWT